MTSVSVLLNEQTSNDYTDFSKKLLFVGMKAPIGNANVGQLYQVLDKSEAMALFGRQSHIYQSLQVAFDIKDGRARGEDDLIIHAIAFDEDVTGNKATASIEILGTATETKILNVYVQSASYYTFAIEVNEGDLQNAIAQKIVDEINANLSICVVASINSTNNNVVDLECTFKSNIANDFCLGYENDVAGLTINLTGFAGGTTVPSIASIKTTLENEKMHQISIDKQFLDADPSIVTFFTSDARINKNDKNVAGVLHSLYVDTYGNLRNNVKPQFESTKIFAIFASTKETSIYNVGNYLKDMPAMVIANAMTRISVDYTPEMSINDFIPNSETTGGLGANSRIPTAITDTVLLLMKKRKDKLNGFSYAESEQLIKDGFILIEYNDKTLNPTIASNKIVYQKQINGDNATINTYSGWQTYLHIQEYIFNKVKAQYQKRTMSSGVSIPDSPQVTREEFANALYDMFVDCVDLGWIRNDNDLLNVLKNEIDRKTKFEFKTGKVISQATPSIVRSLESIIVTLIQTNN